MLTMKRSTIFSAVLVTLCTLPFILGSARGIDFQLAHQRWFANFYSQLSAGEIYPRWLLSINGGLGSPALFIYAPLPFYIASLCGWIMGTGPGGSSLDAAAALSLIVSYSGAYFWLKARTGSSEQAGWGAAAYLVFPYHLYLEALHFYAFAEMWGVACTPLLLLSWELLKRDSKYSSLMASIASGLVMLSHPLTMIPLGLFLIWDLAVSWTSRRALSLLGALSAGAMLAAFYLLPAFEIGPLVASREFVQGDFHFSKRTLFSPEAQYFAFRAMEEITLLCSMAALLLFKRKDALLRPVLILVLFIQFLVTPLAHPLWHLITPLQLLQTPTRFGILLNIALAIMVSTRAPGFLQAEGPRAAILSTISILVLISSIILTVPLLPQAASYGLFLPPITVGIVVGWCLLTARYPRGYRWKSSTSEVTAALLLLCLYAFQVYPIVNELVLSPARPAEDSALTAFCRPEYRPLSVPSAFYTASTIAEFQQQHGTHYISASERVHILDWSPRSISLSAETPAEIPLTIGQFYMQGWTAHINEVVTPVWPDPDRGLISLTVPAGSSRIDIRLPEYRSEQAGEIISLITCFLLLGGCVFNSRRPVR